MKFYDTQHKRLVVLEKQATPDFWNALWKKENAKELISSGKTYHFIETFTKRYTPLGGRILEGGCGTGQVLYCLQKWGYEAYGIDYADTTIQAVQEMLPDLNLSVQDVRKTTFPDDHFDAYWSLGVIEHFWNGYDEIIKEAHRVLKQNGILFLSFPVMSPLRKLKVRLNLYQPLAVETSSDDFYEFMLDPHTVIDDLWHQGFSLVQSYTYDAIKGIKDEIPFFQPLMQKLYQSKNPVARGMRLTSTMLLGRLTGHMTLLVLRKT